MSWNGTCGFVWKQCLYNIAWTMYQKLIVILPVLLEGFFAYVVRYQKVEVNREMQKVHKRRDFKLNVKIVNLYNAVSWINGFLNREVNRSFIILLLWCSSYRYHASVGTTHRFFESQQVAKYRKVLIIKAAEREILKRLHRLD